MIKISKSITLLVLTLTSGACISFNYANACNKASASCAVSQFAPAAKRLPTPSTASPLNKPLKLKHTEKALTPLERSSRGSSNNAIRQSSASLKNTTASPGKIQGTTGKLRGAYKDAVKTGDKESQKAIGATIRKTNEVAALTAAQLKKGPLHKMANQIRSSKKIPKAWKALPTNNTNKKPSISGVAFSKPGTGPSGKIGSTHVRIMPGNPNAPNKSTRSPYVKQQKNGHHLDINGKLIKARMYNGRNRKPGDLPEAHIPFEKYKFDSKLFE